MIARASVVLPQPDSPASARISPSPSRRSTPSTARARTRPPAGETGASPRFDPRTRPGGPEPPAAGRARQPAAPTPRRVTRPRSTSHQLGLRTRRLELALDQVTRPSGPELGGVEDRDDVRARVRTARNNGDGSCTPTGSPADPADPRRGPTAPATKRSSPIFGNAAASARVYGCAGDSNTCLAGPSSTMSPAYMIASRSLTSSRTDRSCVMNSIARPSSLWSFFSSWSTCACTITSSAVVGSSAIDQLGRARERHRDHHALTLTARELVRVVVALAAPAGRPARGDPWRARTPGAGARDCARGSLRRAGRRRGSPGRARACAPWKTIDVCDPTRRRGARRVVISRTSSPFRRIEPLYPWHPCGRSRRSPSPIVDLPHPDSPASPSTSPRSIVEIDAPHGWHRAALGLVGDPQIPNRQQAHVVIACAAEG